MGVMTPNVLCWNKCETPVSALCPLTVASLLPRFNTVVAIDLDLRDCCAAALDTLVPSITHKTLEGLTL